MFAERGRGISAFKMFENNDLRHYTSFYYTNVNISIISSTSLDSMEFVTNYKSL